MKKLTASLIVLVIAALSINFARAEDDFIQKYNEFLRDNQGLTSQGLFNMYEVGLYKKEAPLTPSVYYLDSVRDEFRLTSNENMLLQKHGFFVTERLSYPSFWNAFEDVYNRDLPVFISTDAILHALHMSYDALLMDIEENILISKLESVLVDMRGRAQALESVYGDDEVLRQSVMDYDVYFTVALSLLTDSPSLAPVFPENAGQVSDLLNYIASEQPAEIPLFCESTKMIDFSQFTPRGHYTRSEDLTKYFKTMMWLGRIEIYLTPPQPEDVNPYSPEDIREQIILAAMILESAEESGALDEIGEIDAMIKSLVGESDNVKIEHMSEVLNQVGFEIEDLTSLENCATFQEVLSEKPYADQKILSQMLWADPFGNEKIKPASAFLLFGQRFIIDSYITGSVVYDKIDACRMLPSSLDVLFALGNNAAGNLLRPELDRYGYSQNIAALRYLVDSYGDDFWNESVYASWLKAIRTLNPKSDVERAKLPQFMQTAAWNQEKMNTQLASWAQLRHDNLLYAKQSYSGMAGCSNPLGYVEPIPEFYEAIKDLAVNAKSKLDGKLGDSWIADKMTSYFDNLIETMDILAEIAQKEIDGEPLSSSENAMLQTVFDEWNNCDGMHPGSWYSELFYNTQDDAEKKDFVVADVHTAPTDCMGNITGWVWHVGTGPVNMAVVVAPLADGNAAAFCGPVMSYYEHTSLNFKRLTDEEWQDVYKESGTLRPDLVDLYLAREGDPVVDPLTLPTGVANDPSLAPTKDIRVAAYPNPFEGSCVIALNMNKVDFASRVEVSIFNVSGERIANLFEGIVDPGNFTVNWNGRDASGSEAGSGVYILRISVDGTIYSANIVKK